MHSGRKQMIFFMVLPPSLEQPRLSEVVVTISQEENLLDLPQISVVKHL